MSQINLSPQVRKKIEEANYQSALAAQGYLRYRPQARIGRGGALEAEVVREHIVHEHTVPAHTSHRGSKTYHVPEEHLRSHHVRTHESHHKIAKGGIRQEIEDMTSRLEKMEMKRSHRSKSAEPRHRSRSVESHRDSGHIKISKNNTGGAVLGGAVLGGAKHRKTTRPLTAYQEFMHENLHKAIARAKSSGLEGAAASREGFRETVEMWNNSKA